MSLYWAVTTIATVGYGDIVPNTNIDKTFVMMAMFASGVLQVSVKATMLCSLYQIAARLA